jgi:hypothetical protein
MEGSSHGRILGTVQSFAWRDRGKLQKPRQDSWSVGQYEFGTSQIQSVNDIKELAQRVEIKIFLSRSGLPQKIFTGTYTSRSTLRKLHKLFYN